MPIPTCFPVLPHFLNLIQPFSSYCMNMDSGYIDCFVAYSSRRKRGITVRGRLQRRIRTVSSPCREMYLCTGAEAELYYPWRRRHRRGVLPLLLCEVQLVRGTTRCPIDFEEALNPEGLYWSSGWLHNHFDLFRDRSARERLVWARVFLSVEGEIRVKKGGETR